MIQKILKIQLLILFIYCFLFIVSSVDATTLYLSPDSQNIYQDNSFIAEVRLDTEGQEINTVKVDLRYSSDLLEIVDINNGDSILTLWPKEPFIQNGNISFIAGMPNGFQGQDGLIARLIFRGKETGKGMVSFEENSKVLLNDGLGTESELNFLNGNYEITEKPEGLPIISSKTHPNQDKWYPEPTLHLHWYLEEETEYSYILSYDSLAEPDEIADKPEGELVWMGDIEYKELEDGIYYFHLKQATKDKQQELKWGPKVTFRAMTDTSLPEEFELQITEIEGKNYLVFATKDETSGVEYYEVQERKGDFKKAVSPYLLEDQKLRKGLIIVKAVDKAGNQRIAEMKLPFIINWSDIFIILLILIVIGMILLLAKRILKSKKFPISK